MIRVMILSLLVGLSTMIPPGRRNLQNNLKVFAVLGTNQFGETLLDNALAIL